MQGILKKLNKKISRMVKGNIMPLELNQQTNLSPNCQAFPIVEEILTRSVQLRTKVIKQNGVTILDCGVQVPGGWEAGVLYASICLGGLA